MLRQFYSDKVICILGYQTLVGKILVKKLLKQVQYPRRIYLLQLKSNIKQQEAFLSSNYYRLIDHHSQNSPLPLQQMLRDRIQFVTVDQLKQLQQIDILFNAFVPLDFSNLEMALNSHVLKTHTLCQQLQKLPIMSCVQFSSVYSNSPGLISETKEHDSSINFVPSVDKTKQMLYNFVQDTFDNNLEAWQWSLKFMEESFARVIPHTAVVRVPLVGPALSAPLEGYSDQFNSLTYMIYQIGNGFVTHLNGKQSTILDIVPADYVANYFIAVAPTLTNNQNKNETQLEKTQSDTQIKSQVQIHNLSTSSRHPITLGKFVEQICVSWREYQQSRVQVRVQNKQWARKLMRARQVLPQNVKLRLATLLDAKSWKINAQKEKIALQKKKQLILKYQYFLEHQWICESNKSIDLYGTLSPKEQQMFPFNVNLINWKNYARLCVYGIKKYLLGQQVQNFSSTKQDLLVMSKDSYFSDIIWAFSAGKAIETQRPQQIKNYILSTTSVKEAIRNLVEGHVLKLEKTPTAYEKVQQEYNRVAQEICDQMFSHYEMKSIRVFGWFLHKVFKAIYEKVVIDKTAMNKLKNHDEKTNGPLIVIPTHRSYVDFLIMSYVFFGYGIKVPHIAAAEDFLGMAVIHILLRRSGAFFIKRNEQKYKYLYKAIMTEYISKLLGQNHYLEFFIEGTRSRVGKMLTPKYGILSIIAKNVIDGKIPDAHILPVTINYEKVLQGTSFTYELMGQPKVKETLKRLIKGVDVLKENYGRIYIDFCEPISVKKYFQERKALDYEETVQQLGYHIVHELSDHLIVTAPAILATSILMNRKGISEDSLTVTTNWLSKQIASRNIKIARSQSDASVSISNTLQLLGDVVTKSKKDMFEVQLSFDQNSFIQLFTMIYYRNTLTHIFFEEAIIATALVRFGHQNIITDKITYEEVFVATKFLYSMLDGQFVLRNKLTDEARFKYLLNFLSSKNLIRRQNDKVIALQPNGIHFNFYCSLIWPMVESYWITALYLFKLIKSKSAMPMPSFLKQIQWFAQSLITERIVLHLEAISLDTIKNAVSKFKSMKIIQTYSDKLQGIDTTYVRIGVGEEQLRKIEQQIKLFLKTSYAQSVTGILESGSGAVTLDFPFLSKM